MPSTYSPSLRLELIGSGEQSGTWGTTTNNNLGTLLEQSIAGVQAITMTNANYTLSNFNGVSDEARKAVLVVSGTNTAARDIIAPLVAKTYTIKNNTTGGFAINIKAATGSSVSIPNGTTSIVYCDGTNFNLAVNQTTVAAGTGISIATVGATNTISFGPITSAQLAAAVSDETGSGAAVFATSPTLVTPNLGTPTTLVGTNITGTAASLTAGNATNAVTATTANAVASGITITSPVIAGTPSGVGTLTAATAQSALTTSVNFTGIPSWAKRITVMLFGVSTSGSSDIIIRIGATTVPETSGYLGAAVQVSTNAGINGSNATDNGFCIAPSVSNGTIFHGSATITLLSGSSWVFGSTLGRSDSAVAIVGGGSKTITGFLGVVRITTVNGTDTFDAGVINIMYE